MKYESIFTPKTRKKSLPLFLTGGNQTVGNPPPSILGNEGYPNMNIDYSSLFNQAQQAQPTQVQLPNTPNPNVNSNIGLNPLVGGEATNMNVGIPTNINYPQAGSPLDNNVPYIPMEMQPDSNQYYVGSDTAPLTGDQEVNLNTQPVYNDLFGQVQTSPVGNVDAATTAAQAAMNANAASNVGEAALDAMTAANVGKAALEAGTQEMDKNKNRGAGYNYWMANYMPGMMDTSTAWAKFGQSLAFDPTDPNLNIENVKGAKRANTARGAAALGLGLLGTARNIGAGMGYQNLTQEGMRRYYEKQREGMVGRETYAEDGGTIGYYEDGDVTTDPPIKSDSISPRILPNPPALNYLENNVNLFNIMQRQQMEREMMQPHLKAEERYRQKEMRKAQENPMPYFEEGGVKEMEDTMPAVSKLPVEKAMTGEYVSGLPKSSSEEANSEVEKGEYIKRPDGQIQKVEGDNHEQGGEKINMEDGTQVVSNNLKIGDEAKEIKEKFDLKINPNDTYAKCIDKYTKKIGLQKLIDEQENLFKRLEKNEEVEDEATREFNKQYLSKKINQSEQEMTSLRADRSEFFDYIFGVQEEEKSEEQGKPETEEKEDE